MKLKIINKRIFFILLFAFSISASFAQRIETKVINHDLYGKANIEFYYSENDVLRQKTIFTLDTIFTKESNIFSKSLFRYQEIENPIGRSLADPFIYEKDNEHFIFVEDLFFSDNKGRISVIRVEDEKYEFLGVVLEESFHLSFPFIFDHDGEVFMVPETHQSNDIRLYRCEIFPMKWTLDTVLIDGISAADTMIFKIDGSI